MLVIQNVATPEQFCPTAPSSRCFQGGPGPPTGGEVTVQDSTCLLHSSREISKLDECLLDKGFCSDVAGTVLCLGAASPLQGSVPGVPGHSLLGTWVRDQRLLLLPSPEAAAGPVVPTLSLEG